MKTKRFELLMEPEVWDLLKMLAKIEHISAAAVLRRLIWQEAERWQDETPSAAVTDETLSNVV